MKAGRMRSRIEVFEPHTRRNQFGEDLTDWASCGCWWAERTHLNGRRTDEASEHFADYAVRYNVRIQHACAPGWQLNGDDGLRYVINAIEPYPWLGMQTLVCERLNP